MAYPYFGGYSPAPQYGYQPQPQMPAQMNYAIPQVQQTQPQPPKTNKSFVTSLEAAKSMPADYNSYMIYLDQDKPLLYEIYTDAQGIKTATIYKISPYAAAEPQKDMSSSYATKEELEGVQGQIRAITERLEILSKKEVKKDEPIE